MDSWNPCVSLHTVIAEQSWVREFSPCCRYSVDTGSVCLFTLRYHDIIWAAGKRLIPRQQTLCADYHHNKVQTCRSQWPRSLRRRSEAARLLRLWVRIPPGAWIFVGCQCCVLSGTGLCDELISRPRELYRLCCVVVCDRETSRMRRS